MSSKKKINVLVLGVSLLDGMASSVRVRNLLGPLLENNSITVNNLIYAKDRIGEPEKLDLLKLVSFKIIHFKLKNPFSTAKFLIEGFTFIKKSKLSDKKNILYSYDYPDIKSVFFILYARISGYKVVIDLIEDNDFVTHYVSFINRLRIISSKFFLKISPLATHGYIAISNHLVAKLRSLTKTPVFLIPISVDLNFFKKNWHNPTEEREIKIFYGGSFANKDGLTHLIAAFDQISKKFDHVSLVLTGRGLTGDMETILKQVQSLDHKAKISFKGYLDTEEYYAVMNECDIFCMTRNKSQYANAGFPFKLGEFLAAGKGVIATKVGDVQKYLVNMENSLLIDSESTTQLVDAISYFVNNRNQINVLGMKARATAELNFDSHKLSKSILDIFKTV